jgi:hypothetical protein
VLTPAGSLLVPFRFPEMARRKLVLISVAVSVSIGLKINLDPAAVLVERNTDFSKLHNAIHRDRSLSPFNMEMYANPSLPVFWPRGGLSDLIEMETVCPSSGLPRLVTRTAVLWDIS